MPNGEKLRQGISVVFKWNKKATNNSILSIIPFCIKQLYEYRIGLLIRMLHALSTNNRKLGFVTPG